MSLGTWWRQQQQARKTQSEWTSEEKTELEVWYLTRGHRAAEEGSPLKNPLILAWALSVCGLALYLLGTALAR